MNRQRPRTRVIFEADQDHKSSYVVRGHSADLLNSNDDDEADERAKSENCCGAPGFQRHNFI